MRISLLKQTKTFILDMLFPKFCASCGEEGSFLCAKCLKLLTILAPSCPVCSSRNLKGLVCAPCKRKTPLRRFFAPFSYKNQLARDIVHLYKYGRIKELGNTLADFMAQGLAQAQFKARKNLLFMPIPLHKRRERERGFNQSSLLADALGEKFKIPVCDRVLARKKNTSPQIEMESDDGRRKNIKDAFWVADSSAVKNKIVILVDDVTTSGATLEEAAYVLKAAGAKSVWAAVVARR